MPSGLISWLHTLIDDPELEYCILSPIPCEWGGGAPYDINRFFAVQINCRSGSANPLSKSLPPPLFGVNFSDAVG